LGDLLERGAKSMPCSKIPTPSLPVEAVALLVSVVPASAALPDPASAARAGPVAAEPATGAGRLVCRASWMACRRPNGSRRLWSVICPSSMYRAWKTVWFSIRRCWSLHRRYNCWGSSSSSSARSISRALSERFSVVVVLASGAPSLPVRRTASSIRRRTIDNGRPDFWSTEIGPLPCFGYECP